MSSGVQIGHFEPWLNQGPLGPGPLGPLGPRPLDHVHSDLGPMDQGHLGLGPMNQGALGGTIGTGPHPPPSTPPDRLGPSPPALRGGSAYYGIQSILFYVFNAVLRETMHPRGFLATLGFTQLRGCPKRSHGGLFRQFVHVFLPVSGILRPVNCAQWTVSLCGTHTMPACCSNNMPACCCSNTMPACCSCCSCCNNNMPA